MYSDRITTRKSNIELLRIICMLLIIMHHFNVHTEFVFDPNIISLKRLSYEFLYIGGKVGVNIFILITGYYSYKNLSFKINKLLRFYLQVFFYSVVIYLIFAFFNLPVGNDGNFSFTWSTFIDYLLPITTGRWWFTSSYFLITLLSPFINLLIDKISQFSFKLLLGIMTFFYSIIPTFYIKSSFLTANHSKNQVIIFLFIYLIGAYISKYGFIFKLKSSKLLIISIAICVLTFVSVKIFDYLGFNDAWYITDKMNKYYYELQTIPTLISTICLFEAFLKIDIGSNKIINYISSLTFGIFLIHEHKLLRQLLWKTFVRDTLFGKWLNCPNIESTTNLVPMAILVVIIVFIFAGIIETIRLYMIEPLYIDKVNSIGSKVDNYLNKQCNIK